MNSECCDAPLDGYEDGLGLCRECKEWAAAIEDDEELE